MDRTEILPDELSDPSDHHFAPATVANGTLYMSGQVGTDADGRYVGDDVETQARQAFDNVEIILDAVGKNFDDVVKVTSYLVDIREHYEEFHAVYRDVFATEPYPCHTAIGVESLPSETPLVELEAEVPVEESQC